MNVGINLICDSYESGILLNHLLQSISLGAPPTISPGTETDAYQIAHAELRAGLLPLIIRRTLPDGSFEDWKINELKRGK